MQPKRRTPEAPKIPAKSARIIEAGVGTGSPWSESRRWLLQASWEPSGKEVNLQQKVVLGLELLPSDPSIVREMLVLVSQWAWLAGGHCWMPNSGCNTASLVPLAPSGPPQLTVTREIVLDPRNPQRTVKNGDLVDSI